MMISREKRHFYLTCLLNMYRVLGSMRLVESHDGETHRQQVNELTRQLQVLELS